MHQLLDDWLPPDCIGTSAASQEISAAISQWSKDWFASQPWSALGGWEECSRSSSDSWDKLRGRPHYDIVGQERALLSVALAATGMSPKARFLEADLRLLRRLAARILDNLEERLDALFRQQSGEVAPGGLSYAIPIGVPGQPFLAVHASFSSLVPVIRRSFPVLHKGVPLDSAAASCHAQKVDVSALLGSARMKIDQISGLEVGDVILLDQPCDAPVQLAVSGRITDISCRLVESQGKIILELMDTQ